MAYWIIKSEPQSYSFADLEKEKITSWDGVRNYQARNNLRAMITGDLALFYHSVGPRSLVGIAEVVREFYPDNSASSGNWVAVDVKYKKKLARPVSLDEIKQEPKLQNLSLVKQSRLSVCPVSFKEWQILLSIAGE